MIDPDITLRAKEAMERSTLMVPNQPIPVGRLAPYAVWFPLVLIVRGSQILFVAFFIWYVATLMGATGEKFKLPAPPYWVWVAAGVVGFSSRSAHRRLSELGDAVGNMLASQQCPACGQNIFDHSGPSGYTSPSERNRFIPSRFCTNCGHDLKLRTAH